MDSSGGYRGGGSPYMGTPLHAPRYRHMSPSPSPYHHHGGGGARFNNSPYGGARGGRKSRSDWSPSSSAGERSFGGGFTPSPVARRSWTARGGGAQDDSLVHFATENPWAELESAMSLTSPLGPLNSPAPTMSSPLASPRHSASTGDSGASVSRAHKPDDGFV